MVVDFLNGYTLAAASGALGDPDEHRGMLEMLDARPPGELPVMRRTLESLPDGDTGTPFEFGLEAVLAGLEATVRRRGG